MSNAITPKLHRTRSDCHWATGRVIGLTERRTTWVSGSQGHTNVEVEFFLNDGQRDFGLYRLCNWRIPLRNGQLVTWIVGANRRGHYPVALINHGIEQWFLVNSAFNITRYLGGYLYPGVKAWLLLGILLFLVGQLVRLEPVISGTADMIAAALIVAAPLCVAWLVQKLRIFWGSRVLHPQVHRAVADITSKVFA